MLKSEIKVTHWSGGSPEVKTVAELMREAGPDGYGGAIETLEQRVEYLQGVLIKLIERSGLTDQQVLDITGMATQYRVVDRQGAI